MKKIFTSLCNNSKALLVTALLSMTSISALAGPTGWFNYYVHLDTYPTGAGKVYAELQSTSIKADGANFETPAESVDVMYTMQDNDLQAFTAHAVPNDGWIVAGYTFGTKNEDGTFTAKTDTLITVKNPASISPKSTSSAEDSLTAVSTFPLEADTAYYAVFTHVYPRVGNGQENFGKVAIDKICNNIGDKVTLTATPDTTSTFAYWLEKSTGKQIKDNPLTIDVTKAEEYYAYFESELMETVTFPEGGGYLPYYTPCYVYYPDSYPFTVMVFDTDSPTKFELNGKDAIAAVPTPINYYGGQFAGVQLLYGEGTHAFKHDPTSTDPSSNVNFLRWTGETGVKTDTLPAGHHYYTFDVNNEVFKIAGAEIAAKQVYMAMPDSCVEKLTPGSFPDVIYTKTDGSQTGIATIKAGETVKSKGIYTLDGRKVDAMEQRGIYIYDGKKILYRKK